MTAIDIAVQSKALGAEEVTMVYRRGQEHMNASRYEQEFAQTRGVTLRLWSKPRKLLVNDGRVRGVEFESTQVAGTKPTCSTPTWSSRPSGRKCCWDRLADTAQILELQAGPDRRATTSGERRCPACGPAATASSAARI